MPALDDARRELFAQGVAKGVSATNAYIAAGYKTNAKAAAVSANRLLKRVDVATRVQELLERRQHIEEKATEKAIEKTAITKEWVIKRLVENTERAMQNVPVLDHDGETIGEYRYEGSVANKALELLGKELGMFIERRINLNADLESMSDEDRREVLDTIDAEIARKQADAGRTVN